MPRALMHAMRMVLFAALLAVAVPSALAADARPEHAALPDSEWKAIQRVVSTQLAELRRGDGTRAFAHATAALRLRFGNAETFMDMVRNGYDALLSARRTEFLEGAVIDGVTVQPLRLILRDDTVLVALYTMQKEDGAWRIAGCVIAPSTVRSAEGAGRVLAG